MHLSALISSDEINLGVRRIAEEIKRDIGDEPVILVGVLKGSIYFLTDLSRQLGENVSVDFVQVSSYGAGRSSTGVVRLVKDMDINLEGNHVIVVEDIVDSGLTLSHLLELFSTRKPKSMRVACLLSKPEARKVEVPIDYIGFEIPNHFVVGYGLDDAERYRNLPYIAVLPV